MDKYIKKESDKLHASAKTVTRSFKDVSQRFGTLEHRTGAVEHRVASLTEDVRGFKSQTEALPDTIADKIDELHGDMINDHENRISSSKPTHKQHA